MNIAKAPAKPSYLPVNHVNIPSLLRTLRQWVLWKAVWDGTRWRKVPYQCNGRPVNKTNSAHWTDFSKVMTVYEKAQGKFDGIGFVLTKSDPIIAFDLDRCVDADGVINDQIKVVIKQINSYTELSPSGSGIRIFIQGRIPRNRRKGKIEVYGYNSYVTVTGHFLHKVGI